MKLANELNVEIISQINRRERQILVHSYIYYNLNDNILEDHQYDAIARDLAKLIREYPEEFLRSKYYNIFINFGQDGCYSGYNIPHNQPETIHNAINVLKLHKYYNNKHFKEVQQDEYFDVRDYGSELFKFHRVTDSWISIFQRKIYNRLT